MRLLNALTLELEWFSSEVPAYAILSHTWGSDEISYQEMRDYRSSTDEVVRSKRGFRKIEMSCQRARRDGYWYIWVDTCCIDKASSAELSEAINSMFAWYQRAGICYAYLEDVPGSFAALPDLGDGHSLSDAEERRLMKSEFALARWFTRGWTLQELIAPAEVKFYNESYGFIGSKRSLAYLIKRVTGIDEGLLLGEQTVQAFCIARKMSWAAKRMTTRLEDIAYSLMGIFDVNMPLLYGEGEKAYRRLQEEIIKQSSDESIFAWDDGTERRRSLFAPGPYSYANCGKIMRWQSEEVNEPSRVTNLGVHLRLPLVESMDQDGEAQRRAVLGCRYEDDLMGPLGLSLGTRARSGGYPLAETGPKLVVVPLEDVASATYKTVAILEKYDPNSDLERILPIQGNHKCWIKFLGATQDFEINQAYPSRFWNLRTGVFIPPRGSSIKGGAHFLSAEGMEFILTFGYEREGALPETTRFHSAWVMLDIPVEGRSLEQVTDSSVAREHGTWSRIGLEGLREMEIGASIKSEAVMDETVFVISIEVK